MRPPIHRGQRLRPGGKAEKTEGIRYKVKNWMPWGFNPLPYTLHPIPYTLYHLFARYKRMTTS